MVAHKQHDGQILESGLECGAGGRVATVTVWAPRCQLGRQAGGLIRASERALLAESSSPSLHHPSIGSDKRNR